MHKSTKTLHKGGRSMLSKIPKLLAEDSAAKKHEPNFNAIKEKVSELLQLLHKELGWFANDEEALRNTPERIANFYREWYENQRYNKWTAFEFDEPALLQANGSNGSKETDKETSMYLEGYSPIELASLSFTELANRVVAITDIEFASLCSHHMLPYFGYADIYYIPRNKVLGASKLPRAVRAIASKPSIQEGITKEIAEFLYEKAQPYFILVRLRDVQHTCMTIRGVKSCNSKMQTIHYVYDKKVIPAKAVESLVTLLVR